MAAGSLVLDESVWLVEMHFSFSNSGVVPESVRKWDEKKKETMGELHRRKHGYVKGVLVIKPTEKCSVRSALEQLEAAGFQMWDAEYQLRLNPNNPRLAYHTVRFMFSREAPQDELYRAMFAAVRPKIRADLQEMLRVAMWRVRAFLNPFFKNGEQIPGAHAVSLNFEARVPHGTREAGREIRPHAKLIIRNDDVITLTEP